MRSHSSPVHSLSFGYKRARTERGEEKLLGLQVSLVPHTERPEDAYRNIRRALTEMTEPAQERK